MDLLFHGPDFESRSPNLLSSSARKFSGWYSSGLPTLVLQLPEPGSGWNIVGMTLPLLSFVLMRSL